MKNFGYWPCERCFLYPQNSLHGLSTSWWHPWFSVLHVGQWHLGFEACWGHVEILRLLASFLWLFLLFFFLSFLFCSGRGHGPTGASLSPRCASSMVRSMCDVVWADAMCHFASSLTAEHYTVVRWSVSFILGLVVLMLWLIMFYPCSKQTCKVASTSETLRTS